MNDLINLIAEHFGYSNPKIQAIQKKLSYLLITNDENVLVKKCFKKPIDILKCFSIQEQLLNKQYNNLNILLTDDNDVPYYLYEDELYTVSKKIGKNQISLDNKQDILDAVSELANFHKNATNISLDDDLKNIKTFGIDAIKEDINELDKIKRKISKSKKKTEFDFYVIKNYNKYIERAKAVIKSLEEANYEEVEAKCISNNNVCLSLIKEEQFSIGESNILIHTLIDSYIGYQLNDLIKFIHRYLQKNIINNNTDLLTIDDIISAYSKINNINDTDLKIIYAKLIYPSDFFKIVKKHYKKHRGWTLGVVNNKIKELEDIDDVYISLCK